MEDRVCEEFELPPNIGQQLFKDIVTDISIKDHTYIERKQDLPNLYQCEC